MALDTMAQASVFSRESLGVATGKAQDPDLHFFFFNFPFWVGAGEAWNSLAILYSFKFGDYIQTPLLD